MHLFFVGNMPHADDSAWLLQMRALMYVATLTAEIMRAVAAVEAAWEEAAAHQTTLWPFPHLSRHAHRYAR